MTVDRKKLLKQILALSLVFFLFLAFNGGVYLLFTRRCANNFGSAQSARMIEPERYLPFDENSEIVKRDASLSLTDNLPVLDGATALLPVYSAIIHAVYPEGSCKFDGTEFAEDSAMQYKNTVRGYKAIVDGETDILFCAGPSEAQKAYAAEQGVELVYVPIGLEAFVFLVNENNPVEDLTTEEIRAIYAGEITNWKEVGGENRTVNPLTRLEGSGSQTAMESFMKGTPIEKSPFSFLGASIGFSFRYYVSGIVGNGDVKMLSVNGVEPSNENVKNGTYPIVAQFYAIYRADNENPNVRRLVDWILSDEGQELIEACGYVGIASENP